jgi:hypothetical protein
VIYVLVHRAQSSVLMYCLHTLASVGGHDNRAPSTVLVDQLDRSLDTTMARLAQPVGFSEVRPLGGDSIVEPVALPPRLPSVVADDAAGLERDSRARLRSQRQRDRDRRIDSARSKLDGASTTALQNQLDAIDREMRSRGLA